MTLLLMRSMHFKSVSCPLLNSLSCSLDINEIFRSDVPLRSLMFTALPQSACYSVPRGISKVSGLENPTSRLSPMAPWMQMLNQCNTRPMRLPKQTGTLEACGAENSRAQKSQFIWKNEGYVGVPTKSPQNTIPNREFGRKS
jgi:hypothetical protein